MARVTADNLIQRLNEAFGESKPESYVELLEDISDSVGDVDMSAYTSNEEVAQLREELADVKRQRDDFRDRYINRFYRNYDDPNNKGYIESSVPQGEIEAEETEIGYDALFE